MKIKCGKYLLFLFMILSICMMCFAACDDEESEQYFSVESEQVENSKEEVVSSVVDASNVQQNSDITSSEDSTTDASSDFSFDISIEDPINSSINSSTETSEDSSMDSSSDSSEDNSSSSAGCNNQNPGEGDYVVDHVFVTYSEEPTCTKSGYTRTYCSGCDLEIFYEEFPAFGHTEVTLSGFDSTCCTHGATESTYCETCKFVLIEPEELPFIDHFIIDGCCEWCDLTVLKFESVKKPFQEPYAVCVGPEKYARRVIIPAEYTFMDEQGRTWTYPVKEIQEVAFSGHRELYSVEIGENVEIIGSNAFEDCLNVREVYDKSNTQVTKGGEEKDGCLSRFVKAEDFHYEEFESKITLSEAGCILYTDGEETSLIGCKMSQTSLVIPEGVTRIESYVFELCYQLTEVTIAASVRYIARYAFYYECPTHEIEGEDHMNCKSPILSMTMLNPDGWYLGYLNETEDPMKVIWDLTISQNVVYNLLNFWDGYFIQEELLLNPSTETV